MDQVDILNTVKHYQNSIEANSGNPERLLHCVKKLSRLPINITHLSETGIGKTVNSLRKHEGKLGTYANELVLIWKQMVLEEGNISSNSSAKANSADRHKEDCDSDKSPEVENMNGNVRYENKYKSMENKSFDENQKCKDSSHKGKNENENHGSKHKSHLEHHNNIEKLQDTSKGDADPKYKEKSRSRHDRDHRNSKRSENERNENFNQKERNQAKGGRNEIEQEKELKKTLENNKEKSLTKKEEKDREKRKEHKERHKEHGNRSGDNYKKEGSKCGKTDNKEKERDNTPKKRKLDEDGSYTGSADSTSPSKNQNEHRAKEDNHKRKEKRNSEEKNNSSSSSRNCKELKGNKDSKNENDELNKSTSKKRKWGKDNQSESEEMDGIDSSMGANFADVLGMLNMPSKKSKKSYTRSSNSSESTPNTPKVKESVSKNLPCTSSSSIVSKHVEKPSTSSISNFTSKKPELLTSSVKLEPLDPSIVLDLPTISNNYKPLPMNQTVMACVYNTPQVSSKPMLRLMSDSEALSHSIQSKTVRTKVYSGAKSGQNFQPTTLFELCVRLLQKNIDALEFTGGVPYEVLSPVLRKANPDQLFRFEEYNPYIIEDTDELWQCHVQHNYRSHKRQEMESWREMYLRCREEQERRLSSLTESIKLSTKKLVAPVRKTQLAFVDTLVKPPRNIQRKQEIFGTKAKAVATPASRVAALQQVTPNAVKIGDTRLRVAQSVRDNAQVSARGARPKKAPLMQKTLQLMRGRNKR